MNKSPPTTAIIRLNERQDNNQLNMASIFASLPLVSQQNNEFKKHNTMTRNEELKQREKRDRQIKSLRKKGLTYNEISQKMNIDATTVWRVLKDKNKTTWNNR